MKNREYESEKSFQRGYEKGREDENSFSYNNDKNKERTRGRPPLKEVKNEKSKENSDRKSVV